MPLHCVHRHGMRDSCLTRQQLMRYTNRSASMPNTPCLLGTYWTATSVTISEGDRAYLPDMDTIPVWCDGSRYPQAWSSMIFMDCLG
jgi:hypothetical protein